MEINSDDLVSLVAKTDLGVIVNLSIDYFSKLAHRKIMLNTNSYSLELDMVNNTLTQTFVSGEQKTHGFDGLERNYLFEKMHQEILFADKKTFACTLTEGQNVMHTIQAIQEQNNE